MIRRKARIVSEYRRDFVHAHFMGLTVGRFQNGKEVGL